MLKVRSNDSMTRSASRQTLDTILTAATDEELAAYMTARAKMNPGMVWLGYFRPVLEAIDKATRDEVLSNMAEYQPSIEAGAMEEGPSGSLASIGDEKEDEEKRKDIGNGATSKVGDAMRKWRGQDHDRIAAVQLENEKFWKK